MKIFTDPPAAFAVICVGCANQGESQGTATSIELDESGAVQLMYTCTRCRASMTEPFPRIEP